MNLKTFLKLTRFEHGLMLSFAVLIGYWIQGINIFSMNFYLLFSSLLIPLLIEIGAFSLNDYLDYKSDVINKRYDRPLVNKEISKSTALYIFLFSFVFAVLFSIYLPKPAFYIVIAFAFLSIAYDISLKHFPFIGNLVIAFSMGIPFIFSNAIVSTKIDDVILIIFSMAFFVGVAREILKDIEDMEGDKIASSSKTLPILIGIKNSSLLASIFLVAFMVIAIIPFIIYLKPTTLSLILLIFSYLFTGYSTGLALFQMNERTYKENASKIKKYLLLSMLFGLLSLALASNSI